MKASGTNVVMMNMLFLPVTIFFWPWTMLSFALWRTKLAKAGQEEDLDVFVRRPVSTVMLGLPLASINYICMTRDVSLVLHPLMVHLRAWQNMVQTALEDCVDFAIDLIVILSAPAGEDVSFFWLSFVFSILHLLAVCHATTKEVTHHETVSIKRAPGRKDKKAGGEG